MEQMSPQAKAIETAENKIRQLVKTRFFSMTTVKRYEVEKIISEALAYIPEELKETVKRSLFQFFIRQSYEIRMLQPSLLTFLALGTLTGNTSLSPIPKQRAKEIVQALPITGNRVSFNFGVPAGRYYEDFYRTQVKPIMESLASRYSVDENGKSLRNRAEIMARAEASAKMVDGLRSQGVKLVIVSSHVDCSERCRPYQGRVYSLDGTSGTEPVKYEPIENAIEVYYTTRAGKVWRNGLFGFNCRHTITPYVGQLSARYTKADIVKQYDITKRQRLMERKIRNLKMLANEVKGVNRKAYEEYAGRIKSAIVEYEEYSHKNKRAYYPSRIKI